MSAAGHLWSIHTPTLLSLCADAGPWAGLDFRGLPAQRIERVRHVGSVAVIALRGVLEHRREREGPELLGGIGTSLRAFQHRLREALADPGVTAIVIDVDSPGGPLAGVEEAADELYRARSRKRVTAVANTLATGTAYWLASQAGKVSITASGQAGGIGVVALHEDRSRKLAKEGRQISLMAAGRHKVEANPYEALSVEARQEMQRQVDRGHVTFVQAVARGRGVSTSRVLNGFGQGRMVGARAAVAAGMADRVETLVQAVARLQGGPGAGGTRTWRVATRPQEFDFM